LHQNGKKRNQGLGTGRTTTLAQTLDS